MDPITLAVVAFLVGAAIATGELDEGLFSNRVVGRSGNHRSESRADNQPVHRTRSIEHKPAPKPATKPAESFAERMKKAREAKKNGRKVSSDDDSVHSGDDISGKSTGTGTSGNEPAVAGSEPAGDAK